ncbi:4-(cytidine 5'-diphospho)-2-C-methyl-D-erythritol kinase [Alteromonas sp. ASW11-36]|uniref:4-diphosphocytidyl-2-C-methyl-D-erythritol kinase n=1 Tax=Alteromonas arenosi TaxID=3055817 RepID=A0ABT7SYB8_9ALTE|nr:4-(cytidine 5'-diphospho)-2-C-methyl-D-erythritol kinase [Alteromonas sp. ASW11-36]MDM7861193.1 4-(cytidine 5'-diphospho)-2-C-methyl-D-erythritol kinase [Alteromonas sp. ASW11-36]
MKWWPSPAKLNLFLHITGRRDNGYHELQSVFQMLSFGDELAFDITTDNSIQLMTPIEGVANSDNLIVRAATLLQQHCSVNKGCQIHLRKRLPMGGGIGGGSSNAATALTVLNKLWQCGLSTEELADLGLTLGADVPVFVHGHTAFAEGVGENLNPISIASKFYLVVFPNCHVATGVVFNHPDLPRNSAKISISDYHFETTRNDCQQIVTECYPEVANLLQWLINYAPSRMTGTGACVFAVFDTAAEAQRVLQQVPAKWRGFVAQGVDKSPLIKALSEQD